MSKQVYVKIGLGFALGVIAGYFLKSYMDKPETKASNPA